MEEKYPYQISQDSGLKKSFDSLHKVIVEKVIEFCCENNIEIDEFFIQADGMRVSINEGKWSPATDSVFSMEIDQTHVKGTDRKPFLLSM